LILSIVINGFKGVVNLFLCDPTLTELCRNDALGDLLMLMAGFSPRESEFLIINETGLLKSIDSCLSNLIFNAASFEVSEQLPLTLCASNERIERDCMCSFVRVGAALYLLIEK
jgi:hypothetical protein